MQDGDPLETGLWRRYYYTGWKYGILPATSDVNACPILGPVFDAVKAWCAELGVPTPHIEVDGGVNKANAPELIAAGANVLVAGGSVFSADDPAVAIKELIGGDCPSDMEMANV